MNLPAEEQYVLQWPRALDALWSLLSTVHDGEASKWDGLARWYLLPCSSGAKQAMVRMSHRGLVFCPRYESYQESPAESAASPRSFPVAVEDSLSTQRSSSVIPELSLGEVSSALRDAAEADDEITALDSLVADLASAAQAALLTEPSSVPQHSSASAGAEQAVQQPQQEISAAGADWAAWSAAEHSADAQHESGRSAPGAVSNSSLSASVREATSAAGHPASSTEQSSLAQRTLESWTAFEDGSSAQPASTAQVQRAENNSLEGAKVVIRLPTADSSTAASAQALPQERLAQPWEGLLPFLQDLGLPVLDKGHSHLAHVCALEQPTEQDSIVHKLLQCRKACLFDVSRPYAASAWSTAFNALCLLPCSCSCTHLSYCSMQLCYVSGHAVLARISAGTQRCQTTLLLAVSHRPSAWCRLRACQRGSAASSSATCASMCQRPVT